MLLVFLGCFIAVGAYQLMRTNDTNLSASKSLRQNIEIDFILEEAKKFLRSRASCTDAFGGKTTDDTTDEIRFVGISNGSFTADTNHVIRVNAPDEFIAVENSIVRLREIKLKQPTTDWINQFRPIPYPSPAPSGLPMSTLWVQFSFEKKQQKDALSNVLGLADITRTIPIEVTWQGTSSTIENCFYDSMNEASPVVRKTCENIFGGTMLNSMCSDVNLRSSVSTEGHYCFNDLNGNPNTPGDIHKKDCINSWYFDRSECHSTSSGCAANEVIVGYSVRSCGKNCVSGSGTCCKMRLGK